MDKFYTITLPRGVVINIFDLPSNFKEIVEKTFKEYTDGTSKDYTYCDRLGYIDRLMEYINNCKYTTDAVTDLVVGRIKNDWKTYGEITDKEDIFCEDFMCECYDAGKNKAKLYSHYGLEDHHIYDEVQKVVCEVIKIVMNCEV